MSEALLDASQTTTATLPRGSQVRSASRGSRRNTGARARGFGPATPTRKRRQLPNRRELRAFRQFAASYQRLDTVGYLPIDGRFVVWIDG